MLNITTVIVISFYHFHVNVCRLLWCVCTGNDAFNTTNTKILPYIVVRVPTRQTQYSVNCSDVTENRFKWELGESKVM